ncbi:MAG TPA: aminotransferase class V-fold PLP-dependent enzyme [Steroidobacteraceae bacterium]|nr:aminotransferase class V-fold PLP-dependent enzyme [Steroidobacteraceae bacterium]
MPPPFPSLWCLDAAVTYLNHGSFGACPAAVLAAQSALRDELEREPVEFLAVRLQDRLHAARAELAAFVGADPADLAFVNNATSGVSAVLRSLEFRPGDELLTTNHTYAACRKALDYVAGRSGARVVVATVPFPIGGEDEVVDAVLAGVSPRTRLALLDHVTSPTALVFPLARLVAELRARGVETLVDGAHAPGMVPLALAALGAAYYTGNAHKWLCAPKGAAFLYARRDRQDGLHALTISHGFGRGFQAEFDWAGTDDPTAWLCIPEAIRYLGALLPGGWPELMARNHALALAARDLVGRELGLAPAAPAAMVGSMASLPLPAPAPGAPAARLEPEQLGAWFRARGVRTWLYPQPLPLVRLSAQLYNDLGQYQALARLLREALGGG